MTKLSLTAFACLLLTSACIITPPEDDGNGTSNTQTASNTNASSTTTPPASETGTADGSSGDAPFLCGWGALGPDDDFEFGYLCNGEGEDPDGAVTLECPADLAEGADCNEAGITGQGCCDTDGNAWFCQDPDSDGPMEPRVVLDTCE